MNADKRGLFPIDDGSAGWSSLAFLSAFICVYPRLLVEAFIGSEHDGAGARTPRLARTSRQARRRQSR